MTAFTGNGKADRTKDTAYEGTLLEANKDSNSDFDLANVIVNGDCLRWGNRQYFL